MFVKAIISVIAFLVFAPFVGGILAGLDRKLSAKMQRRVGPPVLQPFYDVAKLFQKEKMTPTAFQDFYVLVFVVFIIASGVIFFMGGDLLLVIFTLTIGAAFLIIAAYSSNSPYAEAGAERELLAMMAYEPMVLLTVIGFYLYSGSFKVSDILAGESMPFLPMIGIFVGWLFILTMKFRKSPFDLSMSHHAHQELVRGMTTEFVGRTMGWIEISHWYENVFLLGFVFLFFANGTWYGWIIGIVVAILAYFLEVLIDNCFARMKWQFAFKSAWIVAVVLGVINLFVLYLCF
ncbi:MAG: NADH-quinone oxidoreductase subunit H [Bacillota bacterium]|nr:NADH-quinone oxidoreductase subunit H [Clostridiales bacterium]MDD6764608.1 NADH-quinone oxidoreductase subunit H [Bacillota bacterium]MDD7131196.1 NADH-quinone oxidoreductase subunit H [Bacillota bacterium]MDO4472212.1 NADH-quinone oxidoreductase subunit H [Bacillota bacterium]